MISPPESLSEILKRETTAQHKAVEQALPLFRKDFSPSDYIHILQKFHTFFRAYESQMESWTHLEIPHFENRLQRAFWLSQDLKSLGVNPENNSTILLNLNDKATVLGAMYVIEGSTLGGQIIVRHLRTQLQLPESATHFYGSYRERTGEFWMEFKKYLDRQIDHPQEFITSAVQSARNTFETIKITLSST